jgi:transcriptional regulator with XRE-family HTH domain
MPSLLLKPHPIRIKREKKGVSLRDLATAANISAQYLSDLELRRRNMNASILATLTYTLERIDQNPT